MRIMKGNETEKNEMYTREWLLWIWGCNEYNNYILLDIKWNREVVWNIYDNIRNWWERVNKVEIA